MLITGIRLAVEAVGIVQRVCQLVLCVVGALGPGWVLLLELADQLAKHQDRALAGRLQGTDALLGWGWRRVGVHANLLSRLCPYPTRRRKGNVVDFIPRRCLRLH